MEQTTLYRNQDQYYFLLTFKVEEIQLIGELALADFSCHLNLEQWQSVLLDGVLVVNSERDKHAIYLLQLACAGSVYPIRKQFMKVYANRARKKV
jgi:hypothetical protein